MVVSARADEGATSQPVVRPVTTTAPATGNPDPWSPDEKAATPDVLVRAKWAKVVAILQNENLDRTAKENEIERIVSPIIDFPLMAKLAMGRDHWSKMTRPQRERFVALFVARLKRSYREKIALYEGQSILIEFPPSEAGHNVDGSTSRERKPGRIVRIPVEIESKGRRSVVLHKFRQLDNRWKLYDAELEGVSLLLTYRSQIRDILRTGTVEELLSKLADTPLPSPAITGSGSAQ
jgi:phospholipid transport system substrate-binding protein